MYDDVSSWYRPIGVQHDTHLANEPAPCPRGIKDVNAKYPFRLSASHLFFMWSDVICSHMSMID